MPPGAAHGLDRDGIFALWQKPYGDTPIANPKPNKFDVGDWVRLSRIKDTFEKGYTPNWTIAIYRITRIIPSVPWTYNVSDTRGEAIEGSFYEQELMHTTQNLDSVFIIEKVLNTRVVKGKKQEFVKFLGYDDSFNAWQNVAVKK